MGLLRSKLIKIKIHVAVTWCPDNISTGQGCGSGHPRGSADTDHTVTAGRHGAALLWLSDRSSESRVGIILFFGLIYPTEFVTAEPHPFPQIIDFCSVWRGPSEVILDPRFTPCRTTPEGTPVKALGGPGPRLPGRVGLPPASEACGGRDETFGERPGDAS